MTTKDREKVDRQSVNKRTSKNNGKHPPSDPPATRCIDPDDSSEILLDAMKKSLNSGDEAPPSSDKIRLAQIDAWDRMSECMIQAAKEIKESDKRGERRERRIRMMVMGVWLALPVVIVTSVYTGAQSQELMSELSSHTHQALADMDHKQDVTLEAVSALNEAMAANIEAQADPTIETEQYAADTAVEAQKKALEAQKKLAKTAHDRAKAEKKLKQVEKKAEDKSAEKLFHQLRPPPSLDDDDE